MFATDLISRLQEIVEENGDMPVVMSGFDLEPSQVRCITPKDDSSKKWISFLMF